MPNHITNIVRFNCGNEKLNEIKNFIKSVDERTEQVCNIDFNKIVPMPEALNIDSSTWGEDGVDYIKGLLNGEVKDNIMNGLTDDDKTSKIMLGIKYLENKILYGSKDWYDWAIKNWGTKWNAYDDDWFEDEKGEYLAFNTAWSTPFPIIKKLSKIFPDVEITLTFADEDAGCNCGMIVFNGGRVVNSDIPEDGSDEAMEYYFKTHEEDRDMIVKDENGKWRWRED